MRKFLSLALFFLFILPLRAEESFPQRRGAVNDFAEVIPAAEEAEIEALAIEVWDKAGVALVICTMPTIGDADYQSYANELYKAWGIGKQGEDKGLLIFNVTDIRKIWIETGYGVEGFINDARAGDVYRQHLVPNFQQGNFGRGFLEAMQAFAGMVSEEYGITFDGTTIAPRRGGNADDGMEDLIVFLVIGFIFLLIILSNHNRSGWGSGGDWGSGPGRRSGSRGWDGSGWGSSSWGGGGWGGGFSGGGGGFGGFGGGGSGGGGAGGGY
ncbi:MAG TPA: TPM domain-containing protein [bacterium]|nr:TPM domain-containing protein [bacterium]